MEGLPWILASHPLAGRPPLVNDRGELDRAALVAWFHDDTCFKTTMPTDAFRHLGIRAGDLLLADPDVDPVDGGLAVMIDDLMFTQVRNVVADENGELCIAYIGRRIPIDDHEHHLCMKLCGWVPLDGTDGPADAALADLDRARLLPASLLHPANGLPLAEPGEPLPY